MVCYFISINKLLLVILALTTIVTVQTHYMYKTFTPRIQCVDVLVIVVLHVTSCIRVVLHVTSCIRVVLHVTSCIRVVLHVTSCIRLSSKYKQCQTTDCTQPKC